MISGSPKRVRIFSSPDLGSARLSTLSSAVFSPTAALRKRSPSSLFPTPRILMLYVYGCFSRSALARFAATAALARIVPGLLIMVRSVGYGDGNCHPMNNCIDVIVAETSAYVHDDVGRGRGSYAGVVSGAVRTVLT